MGGTLSVLCLLVFIRLLTSGKRTPWSWLGLALLYAAVFLAREGAMLLIPVSLALAAFHCVRKKEKVSLLSLAAVSLIPAALAVIAAALACGGWETLRQVFLANFNSAASNPYAQKYGSGPWTRYVLDFLLLSPVPTLLYLVWVGVLIGSREPEEAGWLWALVPLLFLPLSAPITKNVRYALLLEAPIRLAAVGLLQRLTGWTRKPALWMVLAMACLLLLDGLSFCDLFVTGELYDPVSVSLLALRGLIPK